jgi:dipeptidyl aminopeptidase/acylaminoacyl peptidase
MSFDPDVRTYLETRTTAPRGYRHDGAAVAVVSDAPGTAQLHRLDMARLHDGPVAAGDLARLTDHSEPVDGDYLPDRDRLLITTDTGGDERHQLYTIADDPPAPLDVADFAPVAVDPAAVHVAGGVTRDGRRLAYATNRRDGVAFDVLVRDLRHGDERAVWTRGGAVFPAGWSPNGRWLALWRYTDRPGDNRLLLRDVETDDEVELVPHDDGPGASVSAPAWLPDGSACFVSSSVGREFAAVRRIAVGDGAVTDASGAVVVDPGWDTHCAVDRAGRHLLVATNADGVTVAELRDPSSLQVTDVVPLPDAGVAGPFRFSPDGRELIFGFSSARLPGDVWRYDTATRTLTRGTVSPCDVDPGAFVPPDRGVATAGDGTRIPLFVHRPRTGAARHPVVVAVHGGPESQWRPGFDPLVQYLVASGLAVVAPNVRGSTGYGRTFAHLDDVARRGDSIDDLTAVHDWIGATDDLDPDRCALYGRSYGGYMTLSGLVRHPDRWAAGVSVVGIANLVTFLEHTAGYRRAWREREYGSLADDRALLEQLSPITHVDRLRAPLMIVHGRNDPRVPVGEAEQIHDVARRKGLRSELTIYDDEGHRFTRLATRIDASQRIARFLHETLGVGDPHG